MPFEAATSPRDGSSKGLTLRVSLLEQCQYDCGYCRPGSVTSATPNSRRLRADDYQRLLTLFSTIGVRKVRITGGEPLLRPDIVEVVGAFRAALPTAELALTTNGERLPVALDALSAAGLERATVHVDSLRPDRYRQLMGDGDLPAVLAGVLAAHQKLRLGAKLNVVVQRGKNDDELLDFLEWSRTTGVEVRFIELMNTGSAVAYTRSVFTSARELLERIGRTTPIRSLARRAAPDPAALYQTAEGVVFGIISSDTEPFCGACDRLRLTPDGRLRGCLYEGGGAPLGDAMRAGASDAQLLSMIRLSLRTKRSHHPSLSGSQAAFSMADTGG